jgi:hypothetical protein
VVLKQSETDSPANWIDAEINSDIEVRPVTQWQWVFVVTGGAETSSIPIEESR